MSSFSLPLNGNFDNKCWVNLLIGQTECNRLGCSNGNTPFTFSMSIVDDDDNQNICFQQSGSNYNVAAILPLNNYLENEGLPDYFNPMFFIQPQYYGSKKYILTLISEGTFDQNRTNQGGVQQNFAYNNDISNNFNSTQSVSFDATSENLKIYIKLYQAPPIIWVRL